MRKKLLITGGSGFLGKNLANELKNDYEVILTARNQKQLQLASSFLNLESAPSDVSNFYSIDEIISKIKPETVVHAAATKFVNISEKYPNECIDTNITGSQNILRSSIQNNVKNVLGISTDKAAAPIANIYGLSKSVMEKLFTSMDEENSTRFSCVRYGNVTWSTGSVFPIWDDMAANRDEIESTGPTMSRFFFSITDAVNLVKTSLDNFEAVSGKILSYPMKGVKIERILDEFCEIYKTKWKAVESRKGDRPYELLISEAESSYTKEIEIQNKKYFLLDEKGRKESTQLKEEYSSVSCDQLNTEEIRKLIRERPQKELL